jgi:hypothetical protein
MRLVIWLYVGSLFVGILLFASLSMTMLSSFDIPPLDDQQKKSHESNRQLTEQVIEAERRNAPAEELGQIRKKQRDVVQCYFDHNKSLRHRGLIELYALKRR